MELNIPTAEVFVPLLQPARYKCCFGGRGSGKSMFFAGLMVEEHVANPGQRSVCLREVQKSLKESAKLIIEDRIKEYGLLNRGFKIYKELIETPGDGLIIFRGMNDQNSSSILSLEGFDRAWFEEAQAMTTRSLQLLTPTLRKPGSEIWFSWNPRRRTDPVDVRFRGSEIPDDAIIVQANWDSNFWFPDVLRREMENDRRIAPDQFEHTWNGDYCGISASSYFTRQLSEAKAEGRISFVARDPLLKIRAFWDIGSTGKSADHVSIWIAQFSGKAVNVLDHYEAQGQPLSTHVNWLRENNYDKCQCVLPHDGVQSDRVYATTYESALSDVGFDCYVVKNQGKGAAMQRVEALRRLFPSIWFNKDKCEGGLEAISNYHAKIDEARGIDLGPDHDWSSDSADSLGLMAVAHPLLMDNPQNHRPIDYSRHNMGIV
jgi:phage terminase large subunit